MSNTLTRILKLAEIIANSGDIKSFNSLCAQFDAFTSKHKIAQNPLKRNMDYDESENSPYYGNVSDFIKKFPGGIKDWVQWKMDSQNKMVESHFVPEGPDDTEKFPTESHLWSGDGLKDFSSIKDFIKKRRKETGQNSDDAAFDAVKDFMNYWKLLSKSKERRGK